MLVKKRIISLAFAFVFMLSFVSLTSAQANVPFFPSTSGTSGNSVNDLFVALQQNDVVRFIVGDFNAGDVGAPELFFIKALVFILLILLVGYAARKIPGIGDRNSLVILISIIVSLIAIRYITSEELVNFIWLPYGVIGIFLASFFPFILGFFFIESFPSRIFRKIAWSLYVLIFAGLAWFRWDVLDFGTQWFENYGWIYLGTAILSFLLVIYDSRIRNWKANSELKDIKDASKRSAARKVQIKINDLYEDYHKLGDREILEQVRRLESQRDTILRGR